MVLSSDAGFKTCAGRIGSLGFEEIDAQAYASWDVYVFFFSEACAKQTVTISNMTIATLMDLHQG